MLPPSGVVVGRQRAKLGVNEAESDQTSDIEEGKDGIDGIFGEESGGEKIGLSGNGAGREDGRRLDARARMSGEEAAVFAGELGEVR
jgi:hypothetical protein